jgi:transcriptional regulator with XRE-family HTH domain
MTKKVNIPTDSGADLQTVSQAVAVRIKAFRQQQKLSLDELSRRAGVSKGMLVEIEKCLANPSIAMLCKIAAAMGVSVADIVDVASKPAVHLIDAGDIRYCGTGIKAVLPAYWQAPVGPTCWKCGAGICFPANVLAHRAIRLAP